MMRSTALAAVLACTFATPLHLSAQEVPAILSLEDAIRVARQYGPDYQKAMNDLDVASAQVRQSWGAFLPTLNTSLGFNGSSRTTVTGDGDYGQPVRLDDPITYEGSSASQSVSLGFTLFDGGRMFRQLGAARAGERQAEATVNATMASLDAVVTRAFYDAVRRDMLTEVERTNLAAARSRLQNTEERFRLAVASQVDLLEAQRSVINAEQSLLAAETEARKARLSLRQVIGLESDVEFELADDQPDVFDPTTLDTNAIVARARATSPSVRQSDAAYAAARSQASAARGGRWPRITGNFGYSRSVSQSGYGAFGEFNPLNHGYGFGISVSLPLFTGFQTSAQIASAEATADDREQDLRSARLAVERDVRAGLADLEQAYRRLQANQEIATISAQQVRLAEEQLRAGSLTFLQFQQVIDANATAQRQVVEARFAFLQYRVALEERLGAPIGN
jgi:outer membrane protein